MWNTIQQSISGKPEKKSEQFVGNIRKNLQIFNCLDGLGIDGWKGDINAGVGDNIWILTCKSRQKNP